MNTLASVSGQLLWTPDGSPTELDDYAAFLKTSQTFDWTSDYNQLWQWSVTNKGNFWSSLWDWHGVYGEKGDRYLVDEDKMPGARFFPDASLNYAENMLADADDRPALVAYGEDGRCTRLSRA